MQQLEKDLEKQSTLILIFFENDKVTPVGLEGLYKTLKIKRVFINGLAFDICVNFTVLDAKKLGFDTAVIEGATLPVYIGDLVRNTLSGFQNKEIHYGQLDNFTYFSCSQFINESESHSIIPSTLAKTL